MFENDLDLSRLRKDPDKLIELFTQLYSSFMKFQSQVAELEKKVGKLENENRELRKKNQTQSLRIEQLESELEKYTSPHLPSSVAVYAKKRKYKESGLPKSPHRKRGGSKKNKSGITWDQKEPDERIDVYVDSCIECGQEARPVDQYLEYIKRVWDIPEEIKLKLYEYRVHKWCCPSCEASYLGPSPTLSGTSLGINLLTLSITTRYRTGGSFDNISDLIGDNTEITPSGTTMYRGYVSVADAIAGEAERIRGEVMNADWIHGDETSHKLVDEKSKEMGSKKIWVWVFATLSAVAYFVEPDRGHNAIDEALAYREKDKPPPACVSDVYPAYMNKFDPNQYCWAHLLRDSRDKEDHCLKCTALHHHLVDQYRKIRELRTAIRREKRWGGVSDKIFDLAIKDLLSIFAEATSGSSEPDEEPCKDYNRLMKRLLRHAKSYVTCLRNPQIPMTNNYAERLLKTVILHRGKGGRPLRSKKAMRQYADILTVMTTWKLQEKPLAKTLSTYLKKVISQPFRIAE